MRRGKAISAVGTVLTAIAVTAGPTALPAEAAGWIGTCYPEAYRDDFGGRGYATGWCDGNGPDWTYRAIVYCETGRYYSGNLRWAGDRRKSSAYCPDGTGEQARWGGLVYYYKGAYRGEVGRAAS